MTQRLIFDRTRLSTYLDYLPAIFQHRDADFIGRFLLAFEQVLTGLPEDIDLPIRHGIEQKLDLLHRYFDPMTTPDEFLSWLGEWVALTLRTDWSEEEQRSFLSSIVRLYRKRGTKSGLIELLQIYTGTEVEVDELLQPMQIGVRSTIGMNTIIGETPPFHFIVRIILTNPVFVDLNRREQIARAIIEQEKPAHTTYDLIVDYPTMQIDVFSTIGKDTLLGN